MNKQYRNPSRFRLGQKVTAVAFTDCFGVHHPAVENLTITNVQYVRGESIPDYYRYTAHRDWQMIEAAERYFVEAQ